MTDLFVVFGLIVAVVTLGMVILLILACVVIWKGFPRWLLHEERKDQYPMALKSRKHNADERKQAS